MTKKIDIQKIYDSLISDEILKFKKLVDKLSLKLGNLEKKKPYLKKNKKGLDEFMEALDDIVSLSCEIESDGIVLERCVSWEYNEQTTPPIDKKKVIADIAKRSAEQVEKDWQACLKNNTGW